MINISDSYRFEKFRTVIPEKIKEAALSVFPIVAIVLALCLTVSPIKPDLLLCFLLGALMLIAGMGLFSLGAETSMTPIGSKIGTALTKTKKMPLILLISFFLGFAITISEPDLQVLADTVPHINNVVLLVTVGAGVGLFMSVCMFRIITGTSLKKLLLICYTIVFVMAAFSDKEFLSIAFDSGGVTTGPMTVPFILAMGLGVSKIRSDKNAEADSFGLVALCSIGPILSVLILGFFYPSSGNSEVTEILNYENTAEIGKAFLREIPSYMKETAVALVPIVVIFFAFQLISLKISKRNLLKIIIGIVYTYVGLVLFLTGVNFGFSPLGFQLGSELFEKFPPLFLIILSAVLGWFLISAEPAVGVLQSQIEEVSAGAIPGKTIKISLSIAVAVAMGISMLRISTGLSVLWFIVPGYVLALILSFFVPDIYTAIAFDSGGVASGPMTATFMLQFMIGACTANGGNILSDAFGIVAIVAMMPLITIQFIGLVYSKRIKAEESKVDEYGDYDIIELWEDDAK